MTGTVIFTPRWEEVCSPRIGLAQLTEMAFLGKGPAPPVARHDGPGER